MIKNTKTGRDFAKVLKNPKVAKQVKEYWRNNPYERHLNSKKKKGNNCIHRMSSGKAEGWSVLGADKETVEEYLELTGNENFGPSGTPGTVQVDHIKPVAILLSLRRAVVKEQGLSYDESVEFTSKFEPTVFSYKNIRIIDSTSNNVNRGKEYKYMSVSELLEELDA